MGLLLCDDNVGAKHTCRVLGLDHDNEPMKGTGRWLYNNTGSPSLPKLYGEQRFASRDGHQLFIFDQQGRNGEGEEPINLG
jgi:hypothetical protein